HEERPVTEEAVGPLAVPPSDERAGRAGPHGGAAVLQPTLRQLEARARGDVGDAVAVDVERLAEAEAELAVGDGAGDAPRAAPPAAGGRTKSGGRRVSACSGERGGRDDRRETSPARACRRRRGRYWQQPTQLVPAQNTFCAAPDRTDPSVPALLFRSTI